MGGNDSTVMLWRMRDLLSQDGDRSDVESLWQDLAGTDLRKAYRAIEILVGRPAEALASYTLMLDGIAAADWQVAETHLGRARALAALGKTAEARQALADAEDLAPGITETVAADLAL